MVFDSEIIYKGGDAMDISSIGDFIKSQRKAKGITQQTMADQLGVSPQAVSKWERGENLPDIALLPDLAKLLNTTVEGVLSKGQIAPPASKIDLYAILENMQNFLKLESFEKDIFVCGFLSLPDYEIYLDDILPYLAPAHKDRLLDHILKTNNLDLLESITLHLNNQMKDKMVKTLVDSNRLDIIEDIIPTLNKKQRDIVVEYFENTTDHEDAELIENFVPFFDKNQLARLEDKF